MSLSQHIRNLPEAMSRWPEKPWYSNSVRRDMLRKQRGTGLTDPMSTWRSRSLEMPSPSHDAFTRGLTPLACWTSVHLHGIFVRRKRGKECLPFAPWEPNRVPVPRRSLGPTHWSEPDAAGVCKGTAEECGGLTAALIDRGQDEVGSHISWLWSHSLSYSFLLMLLLYPIHPVCCQVVSWCLCFMYPVETVWSSTGSRQRYASSLALCLTSAERLTNSLTVRA